MFRPVAKPRGRSTTGNTSRQSSVAADLRGSGASSSSTDVIPPGSLASMAMPPPTVIPSTTNSTNPETGSFRSGRAAPPVLSTNASSSSVPADNIIVSDFRPSPSPAASIIAPPRNGHIPVSAGQTSGPSRLSASQADSTPTSITSGLPPSEFRHMTFNQVLMAHTPNQNEGLNSSSFPGHIGSSAHHIENATLADELVSQGEPSGGDDLLQRPESRRKSTRGKGALSAGAEVNGNNLEAVSTKPRKSSRPKRSRNSETENTEIQPEDPIPQEARGNVPEHVVGPTNYKRKRRSSSSAPRKPRKTRQPSATPFDPDADPGEELDPTTVTMATLCRDTGQGRISTKAVQIQTNHAAWKASNREKRARMKILMESKKYGKKEGAEEVVPNPENRPADDNAEAGPSNHSTSGSVRAPSSGPPPEDETGHGFDYSESMATSRFNVQVRIGPNGETIIDEESLFVDRVEGDDSANYTHVEESDTTKFVNSATYGKKFRGSRWSAEETELFFDVRATIRSDAIDLHAEGHTMTGTLAIWRELRADLVRATWSRS